MIGMPMSIETPCRIGPCLLENIPIGMTDLIANLTTSSERLANRLHPRTAVSLAELVRIMNCYYSNLIEGHHTKPWDIGRALADDLEKDELQRNFQIEARTHVRLQRSIDRLYAEGICRSRRKPNSGAGCIACRVRCAYHFLKQCRF
jgi:Fic family protein